MRLNLDDLGVTSDSQADWHRIIVSLRVSVSLFEDLVDRPEDHEILVEHEAATKPFHGKPVIILRPFEEAEFHDPIAAVISWPFEHPCRSRFSDGTFGVWYGSGSLETSIFETVHHFRSDTMASSAVVAGTVVVQERRVHLVTCTAALIDLRPHLAHEPRLLDPNDYSVCQMVSTQIYHGALPGVLSRSVRHPPGTVIGVFRPDVLTDPRTVCYLTYHLDVNTGRVQVEREPGKILMEIAA